MLGELAYQLHVRVVEKPLHDRRGHVGRLVPRPQEQSDQWIDHLVPEVFTEEHEPQHNADGNETEYRHCVLDELQKDAEFPDVRRVLLHELTGEDVRPEAGFSLAKGDLELHLLWVVAVLAEEVEGVLEDLTAV